MNYRSLIMHCVSVLFIACAPLSTAYAASVAVQNISPGTTIIANHNVSFMIVPSGFSSPMYKLSDSFANSTASSNDIEPGGRFSWTPVKEDAGTHVLTLTVTDGNGATATVSQTIVVSPPPSISVSAPVPGSSVMPGTKLAFAVTASGFTNPTFSLGDQSNYSLITNANIDALGNFSWTPTIAEDGDHLITVYVSDASGNSASAQVSVHVGAGPTLVVTSAATTTSFSPGQQVLLTVTPDNFSPTGFGVSDSFPGSSVSNTSMSATGRFTWVPNASDAGAHTLTFIGTVGAFGASASTSYALTVLGPNGVAVPVPVSASTSTIAANPTSGNATPSLDALKAQLAQVQGLLASQAQTQVPSQAVSPSSDAAQFTTYLHQGSSGEEVTRLQNVLSQLGFFSAAPNGNYGPATSAAVIEFQAAHGLKQLGVVGPATRAALNALDTAASAPSSAAPASTPTTPGYVFEHFMGVGDDDPDVLQLQQRLIASGYLSGDASGYYGTLTEAAVRKFQKAQGITATGYVDRTTRTKLNQ